MDTQVGMGAQVWGDVVQGLLGPKPPPPFKLPHPNDPALAPPQLAPPTPAPPPPGPTLTVLPHGGKEVGELQQEGGADTRGRRPWPQRIPLCPHDDVTVWRGVESGRLHPPSSHTPYGVSTTRWVPPPALWCPHLLLRAPPFPLAPPPLAPPLLPPQLA